MEPCNSTIPALKVIREILYYNEIFAFIAIPIILILLITNIIKYKKASKRKKKNYRTKIKMYSIIIGILLIFIVGLILIALITTHIQSKKDKEKTNCWKKPIIYIYPEEELELEIKLGNKENIIHSYPKYKDSWKVIVSKDSNIYDKNTKRNYYALYWKGKEDKKINRKEGFIVEGKNTSKFLEEKLEILGLSEKETNEFIIYWLPEMENNPYNKIYFRTEEEINEYMPLIINKKPDTLIRVFMEFEPLSKKIPIKEQKLTPIIRKGFTIVEWGGKRY